jgi:hypothetical protein
MGNWEICRLLLKTASERPLFRRSAKPIVTICFDWRQRSLLAISSFSESFLTGSGESGGLTDLTFDSCSPPPSRDTVGLRAAWPGLWFLPAVCFLSPTWLCFVAPRKPDR